MGSISVRKQIRTGAAWYRGDFHAHTNYSDGKLTPLELLAEARREGLDFFSMTDHNNLWAHPHFEEPDDILIIPGAEVTLHYGHFNVFGFDGVEPPWMESLPKTMEAYRIQAESKHTEYTPSELMRLTAAAGLLNSINHPLLVPWAWVDGETDLSQVVALEIWNDPSWPDNAAANPGAVALWTEMLNDGHRLTAIGGSDFHTPLPSQTEDGRPVDRHHISLPSTYVYAEALGGEAILAAVRQHRAYMSLGPTVALTAVAGGERFMIGDDIGAVAGEIMVEAAVTGEGELTAELVHNGAVVDRASGAGRAELRLTLKADPASSGWLRLDVRDGAGRFLAVTNPIWHGRRRHPSKLKYGDFVALD